MVSFANAGVFFPCPFSLFTHSSRFVLNLVDEKIFNFELSLFFSRGQCRWLD
jgi:hypothetical protein